MPVASVDTDSRCSNSHIHSRVQQETCGYSFDLIQRTEMGGGSMTHEVLVRGNVYPNHSHKDGVNGTINRKGWKAQNKYFQTPQVTWPSLSY